MLPILDYIADRFIEVYRQKGHTVYVFDKNEVEASSQGLLAFAGQGLDAAVVFNNVGFLQKAESGAVCLTDDSAYLREAFRDGEDIVFYSLTDIDKLPMLAKQILADTEKAFMITETGNRAAADCHSWKKRAESLR